MRLDAISLALGALCGTTATTLAFLVPAAGMQAILPATILASGGLAVYLGIPSRKNPPTASSPDRPGPSKTPIAWLDECGALADDLDRTGASRLVRARLESEFQIQPDLKAPHVVILNHILDLARKRGSAGANRAYETFVADLRASIARTPDEAVAVLKGIAAGLPEVSVPLSARHGTVTSGLMAKLDEVRRISGMLPPGEFLWLKSVDRPLWYALNNLGRRTFHVEGAAAISHYQSERALGRAFADPHVDEAVEGIMELWDASRIQALGPEPVPA